MSASTVFFGDILPISIDARRLFRGRWPSIRPWGIPDFLGVNSVSSWVSSLGCCTLSSASTIALIFALPAWPTWARPLAGFVDFMWLSICSWPSRSCVRPVMVGLWGYAKAKFSSLSTGQASTETPTSCALLNAIQSSVAGRHDIARLLSNSDCASSEEHFLSSLARYLALVSNVVTASSTLNPVHVKLDWRKFRMRLCFALTSVRSDVMAFARKTWMNRFAVILSNQQGLRYTTLCFKGGKTMSFSTSSGRVLTTSPSKARWKQPEKLVYVFR